MSGNDKTHVDSIIERAKNNKILAPIIVTAMIIGAVTAFLSTFPSSWRESLVAIVSSRPLDNGWIFVGYLNAKNPVYWTEGPYASILGSELNIPLQPFQKGNRIVLNHDREIIIVDYKSIGIKKVYTAPPIERSVLQREDHTGSIIKAGAELIVRDIWVGHFPDSDYVVWLRVVPATTAN